MNFVVAMARYWAKSLRNREITRYNDLLGYKKTECKWQWVPSDDKTKPKDGKYELRGSNGEILGENTPKRGKSSYLSWILENDSPFSMETRVYSLPAIEEKFWNDMLSRNKDEPGYLTLDKDVEGQYEEVKKMEGKM